jgi:hypothetical protein
MKSRTGQVTVICSFLLDGNECFLKSRYEVEVKGAVGVGKKDPK